MYFSTIKNAVRAKLGTKIIFVVVLLLSAISIALTSFFIARQKSLLTKEMQSRVKSLAQNLMNDCRKHVISNNFDNIYVYTRELVKEKDIQSVCVIDPEGIIRAHSVFGTIGSKFAMPADKNTLIEGWFLTENKSVLRSITPIKVDRRSVLKKNDILYSTEGIISSQDSTIYIYNNFVFPSFTKNSKEVTFGSFYDDFSSPGLFTIDIYEFAPRLLIEGGGHGRWSNNGQYIAFTISKKLTVCNKVTNIFQYVYEGDLGRTGMPCFSYDDTYIITTLQSDPLDLNTEKLFKIPVDGGVAEQLTFHDGQHWYPDCSPDGKYILYTDYKNRLLFVYNTLTGESSRVFPNLQDRHWCGSFSPDGSKFCYLLGDDINEEVYVANVDFEELTKTGNIHYGTQVTDSGSHKWFTDWSSDGRWITYSQGISDERYYDICIVPSAGGNVVNLTASLLNNEILGYVIIDVSLEDLNKAVAESTRTALFITVIMIGVGAISAIYLVKRVVNPVQALADATRAVAHGDFNQTVPVNRNDEIGILAESFNTMTYQLKKSREEIEAWNRELEAKVDKRTNDLAERTDELEKKHNELETAHEDLEKAYKELETLDKAKDDFLSLVSHEMRTPLGSMLLHAEMLLNRLVGSEEKQALYHAMIVNNCKRLTRLINDVLDLSKIEAGRMLFSCEGLTVRELLSDVYSSLRPSFENKTLLFDYDSVPGDTYLWGDRDKIIQVLTNIITNAIKFTPPKGNITVSITTNEKTATLAIKDTGTGIEKEKIPKVFDRFSQLEDINHHSCGTGLGMTISKSIVEHHNGTIWIESELGQGTTVFITLPLAEKPPKPFADTGSDVMQDIEKTEKSGHNPEMKKISILIVDDEISYRLAIADCVQNAGFEPLEAADGNEALRIVKKHTPALIVLDVMMSSLSGLDVCREIRKDPDTRDIKIIMLSARGQEREREAGLKAGADRYMTKPFDYKELIRAIEELLT